MATKTKNDERHKARLKAKRDLRAAELRVKQANDELSDACSARIKAKNALRAVTISGSPLSAVD